MLVKNILLNIVLYVVYLILIVLVVYSTRMGSFDFQMHPYLSLLIAMIIIVTTYVLASRWIILDQDNVIKSED